MRDLMLDLETMSTSPKAAVVAIGAVMFDLERGELGQTFYTSVDLTSCMRVGCHVDGETIAWWLNQNEQARKAITTDTTPLSSALIRFAGFVETHGGGEEKVRIWGNGSDFDNVILASAYARVHLNRPWRHYHNRCYRTMRGLYPKLEVPRDENEKHHALADAIYQAQYLIALSRTFTVSARETGAPE